MEFGDKDPRVNDAELVFRNESALRQKWWKPSRVYYIESEFPRKRGFAPIGLALPGNRGKIAEIVVVVL